MNDYRSISKALHWAEFRQQNKKPALAGDAYLLEQAENIRARKRLAVIGRRVASLRAAAAAPKRHGPRVAQAQS